ncbi:MAG: hypothetical protein FWH35_01515 [Treponema sp.]|nr:hypothetical protein [Treponema sp.]
MKVVTCDHCKKIICEIGVGNVDYYTVLVRHTDGFGEVEKYKQDFCPNCFVRYSERNILK